MRVITASDKRQRDVGFFSVYIIKMFQFESNFKWYNFGIGKLIQSLKPNHILFKNKIK